MATTSPSTRRSPRLGGNQQSSPISSSRKPRNNVARKLTLTSNKTSKTKFSPEREESIPFLAINTPNQHNDKPSPTKSTKRRNSSSRTKPKQKTANEALGNPQIISRRRRRAAVTPRTRGKSIANLLSSSPSNNNSTTARTGRGSTSSSATYLTPGKRSAAEAILHKVSKAKSNGNNNDNTTTALHSLPQKKRRKVIRKAASDANEKVRDICQMDEFEDLNNISPSNLVPYNKPKATTTKNMSTGGQEVKAGRKSKGMSELVVGDSNAVQQQQGDIVTVDTFIPKGKVEERWFKNFKKWNSSNSGDKEGDTSSPIPKRWEKEQRAQYRLLQQNKKTQMTKDRMKLLDNSGFVWDVQQKGGRKDDIKQVVSNDTVIGGKAAHKTEGASISSKEDGSSKDDSPSKRQSPRKSPPTQFYHNLEKDKGDDNKSTLSKPPSAKKSTVNTASTTAATNTKSSPSKSPSKRSLSNANNSLASLSTENKSENNQQQKKKKKRRGRHSTSSLFSLEGSSNDTVPSGEDYVKKESTSFSHSELKHELSKKKKRKPRKKKDTTGGTNEAAKKEEEKTSDNSDVLAATKKANDTDKQSSGKKKTYSSPAESPLRVTKLLPTLDKGASSLAKVSKDTADKEEAEESVCVTKLLLSCLSEDSADKGIQSNSQKTTKETTEKAATGSKRDSSPSRKSPRKSPPTQFYHNLEKDSGDDNNKTSPEKPNNGKKKSSPQSPKKVTVSASASKWVDSPVISTPERAKLEAARAANTKDIPELGLGWEVNVVPRKPGSSKRVDKYYLSPTGQRFNSMKRAKAHAQEESDKAVSEEKTSAVQDPPSNEQKEQVEVSAKSQQQSSPWTCDVCQDATFDDYDEAVAHEKECAIASNNSQVVESSNKEKETTISAGNSTVEEETGKNLQSNDVLPPAAKVNLPEQPTAPQKERPSVGSDGRQGGSWTCDVCKTATFDDYDEAVAHEEKCAIEQRENRSQKNDSGKVTVHHSRGKKRKSSLQSLESPENEVAVPPTDDLADNTHTKPSSSTPNDKKSSTDLVPITATHVGNKLAIVQHTRNAADESSLPLFSPLSLTSPLTHADNRVGDSQLQMVIAEKQYEEKMAEFGRLKLEAKMVTQRMREIEQKIKGFGSNKVSNDLINMEEGYESVSHKRYQSKSKSSRRSITHNWSSHHYSSEEEQYDDRHYTPRKRRHTHMMSTNDIESRMYSGRKSRRRSDTYESQRSMSRRRGGSSRNRPSFDDYDDDSEIQEERTSKRRHRSVEHFSSPERYSNRRSSGKRKRSKVSKLPAFADEGPRKKKSRPKQKTQSQHLFDGIRKENSRRKPEVYRGDEYSDEETGMLHSTKPQVKSHTQSNVSHPQPAVEDNDVDKKVGAADEASGGENSSDEESWDFEAGNMILPPPPM